MEIHKEIFSKIDIEKIKASLNSGLYSYDSEFRGCVGSGMDEDSDGLYLYVKLDGDDKPFAYALHTVKVNDVNFHGYEHEDGSIDWYIQSEKLNVDQTDNIRTEIIGILESIIDPFDFEEFALSNFDGDAIGECVQCLEDNILIIDNGKFSLYIKEGESVYKSVKRLLKSYGWSNSEIRCALSNGFEITDDVYDACLDLEVRYIPQ